MFVINGKRIKVILVCIFLGVFVFSFQVAKEEIPKYVLETFSHELADKVVILDAGHGNPDGRSCKR